MKQRNREQKGWVVLEEIKKEISVLEVLEHFGWLKKIKFNEHGQGVGPSPWHDKKMTFTVNRELNVWNDHSGRPLDSEGKPISGNVVGLTQGFIKRELGKICGYHEAGCVLSDIIELRNSAKKQIERGITGEISHLTITDKKAISNASQTYDKKVKNDFFGKELKGLRSKGLPYFEEKGIQESTVVAFGSGYCSRGYHKSRIVHRILRYDMEKQEHVVVAYAGRATKKSQEVVWKVPVGFSSGLELAYHPSLYDSEEVREIVRAKGIIIVPGFTAIMKLWQEGFLNVVSTIGHSITQEQIELIRALDARAIKLFYDNRKDVALSTLQTLGALSKPFWCRLVDHDLIPEGSFVEKPENPEDYTREELSLLLGQEPQVELVERLLKEYEK